MTGHLAAFVGTCIVVIVTPGPDTALVIRNALCGGRPGGVGTALGVVSGQLCWTLAACTGITAPLSASRPVFAAIKLAGAGYLVILGARGLRDALRATRPGPSLRGAMADDEDGARSSPRVTPLAAARQGMISNLGNPKSAVFFLSLLPQFVPEGQASFLTLLALLAFGLIYCSLTLVWLACYGIAAAKIGEVLRRPGVRRALEALTGGVLIMLGLRLGVERA